MVSRPQCSCCRAEVEIGCDLCRYCREDYERRQWERVQEEHEMPDEDFYHSVSERG